MIDPAQTFAELGADATRWYFYSAVAPGSDYRIAPELIRDVVRRFILTLWNVYKFFCEYARLDGYVPEEAVRAARSEMCIRDRSRVTPSCSSSP